MLSAHGINTIFKPPSLPYQTQTNVLAELLSAPRDTTKSTCFTQFLLSPAVGPQIHTSQRTLTRAAPLNLRTFLIGSHDPVAIGSASIDCLVRRNAIALTTEISEELDSEMHRTHLDNRGSQAKLDCYTPPPNYLHAVSLDNILDFSYLSDDYEAQAT